MFKQTVQQVLTLDYSTIILDKQDILEKTLPGWHRLVHELWYLLDRLDSVIVTRVWVDKGLLRIEGGSTRLIENSLFERVAQSIAKDSALTCLVCGQRGYRRKMETGWPCLCREHYIEYVNDDEEGSNGTDGNQGAGHGDLYSGN